MPLDHLAFSDTDSTKALRFLHDFINDTNYSNDSSIRNAIERSLPALKALSKDQPLLLPLLAAIPFSRKREVLRDIRLICLVLEVSEWGKETFSNHYSEVLNTDFESGFELFRLECFPDTPHLRRRLSNFFLEAECDVEDLAIDSQIPVSDLHSFISGESGILTSYQEKLWPYLYGDKRPAKSDKAA
ncbi:hypothetical protein [Maridesulfovibrio ferrireducens]|uniref:hypothetical protein n=1 Tax=Maridesulfovibrio ferrireducens TaxID=246191 RepID=UPI001A23063A|nr:hypothetical protein [Maridesulfovibrio ferrireducens]MBI9113260.1 hypothetical protein [Maridesulfovibrio ferrireducens]